MAAGCNYYITAEDVAHTHALDRAKLMLEHEPDIDYSMSKHQCELCDKPLADNELELIDNVGEKANEVTSDDKMSIFYIAGYVAARHPTLALEDELIKDVPDELKFNLDLNWFNDTNINDHVREKLFYIKIYCFR